MQLTIFGATGGTGTRLVDEALRAGHDVTAVVRDPSRLSIPPRPRLQVVTADVMEPADVVPVVEDADAVVSALGPRDRGPTTVSSDGARSIVAAMEKTGSSRLLVVTGSIVDDAGDGFVMRSVAKPLFRRTFLREVCADMRRTEAIVRESSLDWTIVRPPRLLDQPASGRYRVELERNVRRGVTISRADLAIAILDLLDRPDTVHHHVFVAK
jgi:putative NADH-flavin reductase